MLLVPDWFMNSYRVLLVTDVFMNLINVLINFHRVFIVADLNVQQMFTLAAWLIHIRHLFTVADWFINFHILRVGLRVCA